MTSRMLPHEETHVLVTHHLQRGGRRHRQWAPTFLIFGLYNKLVKQLGSDRIENAV